eukprot:TRINITY_DN72265_c0_g1_i1.p1 TRINITY_DN72265_c0_g1~~TRINITY_DN72265_c0_g1_i1.p1  ORF type:complete len:198 (-),score=26.69 TRINITY_DN72265_c0_g1_i1:101-613(-)
MAKLEAAKCPAEVCFQWIQLLIVDAMQKKVFAVEPPIVTRVFQDLGSSMSRAHKAEVIADVPFPFPFSVALQILLYAHWLLTMYVATGWSDYILGCASFSFCIICCLWFFVAVALEIDRPYSGITRMNINGHIQRHFNSRLLTLLRLAESPRLPKLKPGFQENIAGDDPR